MALSWASRPVQVQRVDVDGIDLLVGQLTIQSVGAPVERLVTGATGILPLESARLTGRYTRGIS
jgi:hypothetical protein